MMGAGCQPVPGMLPVKTTPPVESSVGRQIITPGSGNDLGYWKARAQRAEFSLETYGFRDEGGLFWKPPLRKRPDFDTIDRLIEQATAAERMAGIYAKAVYETWLQLQQAKETIKAYEHKYGGVSDCENP